jgi:phosphoenolpyruvate synthase/pyruvate phosphate dikinase
VDVEWAVEKNIFYIVQSRPITTLTTPMPKDSSEESEDKKKVKKKSKMSP